MILTPMPEPINATSALVIVVIYTNELMDSCYNPPFTNLLTS